MYDTLNQVFTINILKKQSLTILQNVLGLINA